MLAQRALILDQLPCSYLELDTQAVSSAASIGCTIISGHSCVRNRSKQSIYVCKYCFSPPGRHCTSGHGCWTQRAPILDQLHHSTTHLTHKASRVQPVSGAPSSVVIRMFVTAASKALCLQVLFFAARKTLHWWTWLLDTACSNTRSATLYVPRTGTQGVSSAASIGFAPSSVVIRVFVTAASKALCLQVLFLAARKTMR